jgi:hypothetical protein
MRNASSLTPLQQTATASAFFPGTGRYVACLQWPVLVLSASRRRRTALGIITIHRFVPVHAKRMWIYCLGIGGAAREDLPNGPGHDREQDAAKCDFVAHVKLSGDFGRQPKHRCRGCVPPPGS